MEELHQINNDEIVKKALELRNQGHKLSEIFKTLGKKYGKNPETVKSYYYYHSSDNKTIGEKLHGNCKLTEYQERILLHVVISFSCANLGLTVEQVIEVVKVGWDITISEKWVRNFRKRHSDTFQLVRTKPLNKARQDESLLRSVKYFIQMVEVGQTKINFGAKTVVNYDETRVCVDDSGKLSLEFIFRRRRDHLRNRKTVLGSLLSFIVADGTLLASFWVAKQNKTTKQEKTPTTTLFIPLIHHRTRSQPLRYWTSTETGFLNTEEFFKCIKKIIEIWEERNPGLAMWLFGDQLSFHKNLQIIEHCLLHQVYPYYLPLNSSHFTQPLDSVPFASFKKVISKKINITCFENFFIDENKKEALWNAVYNSEKECFTPEIIKAGFEQTGLYPWAPELLMTNAKQSIGLSMSTNDKLNKDTLDVCTRYINQQKESGEKKRKRIEAVDGEVSPFQLVDGMDFYLQEQKKKKLKEEKQNQKDNWIARHKCKVVGCKKIPRFPKPGKKWYFCPVCNFAAFCPSHTSFKNQHIGECWSTVT